MADTIPVHRTDLEGVIDDVDKAIHHAIASQTAPQNDWRLASFVSLLGELRNIRLTVEGMATTSEQPTPIDRVTRSGGRK